MAAGYCKRGKQNRGGVSQLHVDSFVRAGSGVDVPEVLLSVEYNSKSGSMEIRARELRKMSQPDGES